jgi:hypothetical protein
MVSAASGTAYSHPKRTAAVTVKTLVIETSCLPPSPIGIGCSSARSASAKNRRTPAAVSSEGGLIRIPASARTMAGMPMDAVAAM